MNSNKNKKGALNGKKAVALTINLPGPMAAYYLAELGAEVIKLEPGSGDPLFHAAKPFYQKVTQNLSVEKLDKDRVKAKQRFTNLLKEADIFVTSTRLSAVKRLGIDWENIGDQFPHLVSVAIVGDKDAPEIAGHDLNYQASCGLLENTKNPTTLIADMSGALQAKAKILELLFLQQQNGQPQKALVSLVDCAREIALPYQFGMTGTGKPLGGELPYYRCYPTKRGSIAIALLEQKFLLAFFKAAGRELHTSSDLERFFSHKTAIEWEQWAKHRDLPINAISSFVD